MFDGFALLRLRKGAPPQGGALKNWSIDSSTCFPPRKSLVKGERFMRIEGKPKQRAFVHTGILLNMRRQAKWDEM